MIKQLDYTGKLCVASVPFLVYKDVETIDCLVPHEVNPEEILFIVSCDYHDASFHHLEAILEIKFLFRGEIYQNQFNWGSSWGIPFQEVV
jgi:hypothetical protein|tara:strand:- start:808 stop:1077 length:270 start_codon:yes stop_codon:yes gene_type:complete